MKIAKDPALALTSRKSSACKGAKSMSRRLLGFLVLIAVGAATFYGVNRVAIGFPPEPTSTPAPGLGLPPNPEYPVIEGESIDLWKPLKEPFQLEVAGYKFIVPAGATALLGIEGPPVVDSNTGQLVGEPNEHPHFWLISRNGSSVRIDDDTGELFEWEVKPEDARDFEPLRHPR